MSFKCLLNFASSLQILLTLFNKPITKDFLYIFACPELKFRYFPVKTGFLYQSVSNLDFLFITFTSKKFILLFFSGSILNLIFGCSKLNQFSISSLLFKLSFVNKKQSSTNLKYFTNSFFFDSRIFSSSFIIKRFAT